MSRELDAIQLSMLQEYEDERNKIQTKLQRICKHDMNILKDKDNINLYFGDMLVHYPKRLFEVVFVMSEESGYDVEKIFKYLDGDNKTKLKNYAKNFYNTTYYEKKELEKLHTQMRKKGQTVLHRDTIEDLFE